MQHANGRQLKYNCEIAQCRTQNGSMTAFGKEVDAIWPTVDGALQPISEFGRRLLQQCESIKKPDAEATIDLAAFMGKSSEFPLQVRPRKK